jgi:hypothetical protein
MSTGLYPPQDPKAKTSVVPHATTLMFGNNHPLPELNQSHGDQDYQLIDCEMIPRDSDTMAKHGVPSGRYRICLVRVKSPGELRRSEEAALEEEMETSFEWIKDEFREDRVTRLDWKPSKHCHPTGHGEDVANLTGPDGQTEQLPPYTRYPDGIGSKTGFPGPASILSGERPAEAEMGVDASGA